MQMRGDDANPRQHACITVSLSRLTLLGRKSGGCEDPSFWSVKYRRGYLLPLKIDAIWRHQNPMMRLAHLVESLQSLLE